MDFEPAKLVGPEKAISELRSDATKAAVGTTDLEPFLRSAGEQFAALDLKSRLRGYRSGQEAQAAANLAVSDPLNKATNALGKAKKDAQTNQARAAELAERKRLDALDDSLLAEASTAAGAPGKVRDARVGLRQKLDREKARPEAINLKFTFDKSEAWFSDSEDTAWVEEANEVAARPGTNSIPDARKGLLAKLQSKTGGYAVSRERARSLETAEKDLAQRLLNEAKAQQRKEQELALRKLDEAKAQQQKEQELAIKADTDRASAAASVARTDVSAALVALEEKLKASPGSVTTESTKVREELLKVRNWLASPEFKFNEAGWNPEVKRAPADVAWAGTYGEVTARNQAFANSKSEWDAASGSMAKIEQFKTKAELDAVEIALNRPLLANKATFEPARLRIQTYKPLVNAGELLRTSSDTNILKTEIASSKTQTPPYFNQQLVPALEQRLSELIKDWANRAVQEVKKAEEAAGLKVKQDRLAVLKTGVGTMAKGVGGVIVTVIQPGRFPAQRGVSRIKANEWKTALQQFRVELAKLLGELEPSTDLAKLNKELDALDRALQEAMIF